MSSKRITRRFAALGLLALGACGFAPVYGPNSGLRGAVDYDLPETVAGFRLQQRFEQRLGAPTMPRYTLKVTLVTNQRPATINAEGDTTRFNLIGTADWTLTDNTTGVVIKTDQAETFTSYAATGSTVATQAAETDATARLSTALADLIVSRLMLLGL